MSEQEIKNLAEKNAYHLSVMNTEMGQLRDSQKATQKDVGEMKVDLMRVCTNTKWLMRSYWMIAGASVTSLIGVIVGLLFK